MPNICYTFSNGTETGTWPGKSVRMGGKVHKEGQLYLGRVVNKEKHIFWKREKGYYRFDPVTLLSTAAEPEDVEAGFIEPDKARRQAPVIVDFGDAFFLDGLLRGTGYDKAVLDAIGYSNGDTLRALIAYYMLDCAVAEHALSWYRQSAASYLWPKANLHSQRISEAMEQIGRPERVREFLLAHIKYILDSTDDEVSVIIDSTGLPNSCALPITRISRHESEVYIEFRLIAVVQKSTGLPLYYEYIAGNIVDMSTLERTIICMAEHRCKVEFYLGDAAFSSPADMETMALAGVNFMTRLNPAWSMFQKAWAEHGAELDAKDCKIIRYNDRLINVVKCNAVMARRENGEEVGGFVFLCRDKQAQHSQFEHMWNSKRDMMTDQEAVAAEARLGVFAIAVTVDMPEEAVVPGYYLRQSVEQYFDFGKNYAHFLPVAKHTEEVLRGHLLIAFIASFLCVLIKNRLGLASFPLLAVSAAIAPEGSEVIPLPGPKGVDVPSALLDGKYTTEGVRTGSFGMFHELRGQKSDVFAGCLVPSVPTAQAKSFYKAFGLCSPTRLIRQGLELKPDYTRGQPNITRALVFARKVAVGNDEILLRRQQAAQRRLKKAQEEAGISAAQPENTSKNTKHPGGRPKGSKNKSTLERERKIASGEITPPPKRSPGRPKGAKNKATLERERKIASGELKLPRKRSPGRPKGAKDTRPRKPYERKKAVSKNISQPN